MAIPKVIHYCWFGKKKMPANLYKYIETWKKYLSDYQIIEWNEDNFDISTCEFVKQAYAAGKYAFVSDYVRLYALKKYGGIYFDVDIQVLKNLDKLLNYDGIFCFESTEKVMTAFMAVSENHPLIQEFLQYYEQKTFDVGSLEPNTVPLTALLVKRGLMINNQTQILNKSTVDGTIGVFSNEYFNAYDFTSARYFVTPNTYTIHHCVGSWCPLTERIWFKCKHLLSRLLGEQSYEKIKKIKKMMRK